MTDTDLQLLQLLRTIVSQTPGLSNEVEVFDLESARLWWNFRNGGVPQLTLSDVCDEDFEFGDMAPPPIQIEALLWGTYRMVSHALAQPHDDSTSHEVLQSEIQRIWALTLIEAGLTHQVANEIVAKYGARTTEVLHSNRSP